MLRIPIMDAAGTPTWPDVFGTDKINEIRTIVGERHFSSQMMLNFVPMDGVRLDPEKIKFYDDDFDSDHARIGNWPINAACVYWDPSSAGRGHDGSVCVILYRDDISRHVFIHDVMYMSPPENIPSPITWQCGTILNLMSRYQMRRIAIETNGIGGTLPEIMRSIARARGIGVVIDPVSNHTNKEIRICDAIEPLLGSGRMHAHTRITKTQLLPEMIGWTPNGATHDDGLDAVAGAISCRPMPVRATCNTPTTIYANTEFNL